MPVEIRVSFLPTILCPHIATFCLLSPAPHQSLGLVVSDNGSHSFQYELFRLEVLLAGEQHIDAPSFRFRRFSVLNTYFGALAIVWMDWPSNSEQFPFLKL